MTAMASATSIASSWSCVTRMVVTCTSSCNRRSQVRSSSRTRASRAPKGSSSNSTFGSTARARARAMRWRWPPESWSGYRSAKPCSWTRCSKWLTRSRISCFGRLRTFKPNATFSHGHVLEGRVVLEDEADAALLRSQPRRLLVEDEHVARVGLLKARDDPQQRRFATAAGTQQGRERAGRDVKGDIVEGDEVPEPLADVPDRDGHQ